MKRRIAFLGALAITTLAVGQLDSGSHLDRMDPIKLFDAVMKRL